MAHVNMALNGWDDYLRIFDRVTWEKDYGVREAFGSMHQRTAVYEPVGVVAAITPWNVPLYVNIGKVVAALLAGLHRDPQAGAEHAPAWGPSSASWRPRQAFPAGVMQVVFGQDPALAGEMLTADPRVDNISFTGFYRRRQAHHGGWFQDS